jgi:hypothetical protein
VSLVSLRARREAGGFRASRACPRPAEGQRRLAARGGNHGQLLCQLVRAVPAVAVAGASHLTYADRVRVFRQRGPVCTAGRMQAGERSRLARLSGQGGQIRLDWVYDPCVRHSLLLPSGVIVHVVYDKSVEAGDEVEVYGATFRVTGTGDIHHPVYGPMVQVLLEEL